MNFNDLYRKIADLDKPVSEATVEECGMMGGMSSPSTTPPSMSVNISAQGMDDISSLMKLISKVNPDMPEPAITPIGISAEPMGNPMGNPDTMTKKLLPAPADMDGEEDGEEDNDEDEGAIGAALGGAAGAALTKTPGGAMTGAQIGSAAQDALTGDDEDESMEPAGEDQMNDEDWGNSQTGAPGPEVKDTEFMTRTLAGGMNKEKHMIKHNYKGGDNPYAMPESDLRAQIKAELNSRLQLIKEGKDEGKPGKNFAKIAKKAAKKYGSKEAGERVAGAIKKKVLAKESFEMDESGQKVMVIGYNSGRDYPLEKAVQDPKSKREVKNPQVTMDPYSGAPVLKFYELDGDGPFTAEWHPKYGWTADFD